ncbi:hypothetical protein VPDG_00102 [Vibrio phage henriette 12B8]|uniref:hypothetical protein n=1 Tax=Vibrio phage henriette 12B8 TaxID=573174 RepID=UPI0002C0B473|nr:hypothetical protein VPDG_00102 [Vibrio phage henriette 12B8]AGG58263.1 hypothetical protein VPDG_00102 [Vibrio phage henriette 12B8]
MIDWALNFYAEYELYIDDIFGGFTLLLMLYWFYLDIRRYLGKDVIITPQMTLVTDDGDKIFVLSVEEEQGRYVLYHSRNGGLQLCTFSEFVKLKDGGGK